MLMHIAGQELSLLSRRPRTILWFAALALSLWVAVLACGFAAMGRYEFTPGDEGPRAANWPADTAIPLDATKSTLVVFAHPRCPCTRATLDELERIVARAPEAAAYHVCFTRPAGTTDDFHQGFLFEKARSIPGVSVAIDDGGIEAERFGARTSGDAVLYAPDGELLFHGGITGSRGHAGENEGQAAVIEILSGGAQAAKGTCVFGCPLRSSAL
ncbi:MAG: hypothetical protein WD066_12805 [Planctomycetaceae bacterium]